MYNKKIMEIFKNPKNVGGIKGSNGIGKAVSPVCGDVMKMYIVVNEEEVIQEAKFKTCGGVPSIAASSIATELIKGKTVKEALTVTSEQILNELGELPENKQYCATMAEEVIKNAIDDYFIEKEKEEKKKETK